MNTPSPLVSSDQTAQWLGRVSRTFAIGIAELQQPLRDAVGATYLLCRLLDTIEDTPQLSAPTRIALLDDLVAALQPALEAPAALVRDIERAFQNLEMHNDDIALAREANWLFDVVRGLDENLRWRIAPHVIDMAQGMATTIRREHAGQGLELASFDDLDRYCFYVAGTVGQMLTELFASDRCISGDVLESLREHEVAFGLGLQITNVIKGITVDLGRGVVYVPADVLAQSGATIADVIASPESPAARTLIHALCGHTLTYLERALLYTCAIPNANEDVRRFCTMPMLFALRTLRVAAEKPLVLADTSDIKITRAEVNELIATSRRVAGSNDDLHEVFAREQQAVTTALNKGWKS